VIPSEETARHDDVSLPLSGFDQFMAKKILITGGCGFIGSHLAQYFCKQDLPVIIIDNLSSGKMWNLDWKTPGMDLDLVEASAGDEAKLRQILPSCLQVFHFAAIPSVLESVEDPAKSHHHNLDVTLKILLAAREARVERFIFASSCAVYGDSLENPKTEMMVANPLSPYALQKHASENYCRIFFQLYRFPAVSLRFFNVYGPRQSHDSGYSGVIARFCNQMLQGLGPEILGDGQQTRDFVYVENVVEAAVKCAAAPVDAVAGKCFNIATGKSVSLIDLVDTINRLTGQNLKPSFGPARLGDIRISEASIDAARVSFGYEPKIFLTDGLSRMLDTSRQL
jgi:nucleoside-diphosphate-sugar epimerase